MGNVPRIFSRSLCNCAHSSSKSEGEENEERVEENEERVEEGETEEDVTEEEVETEERRESRDEKTDGVSSNNINRPISKPMWRISIHPDPDLIYILQSVLLTRNNSGAALQFLDDIFVQMLSQRSFIRQIELEFVLENPESQSRR